MESLPTHSSVISLFYFILFHLFTYFIWLSSHTLIFKNLMAHIPNDSCANSVFEMRVGSVQYRDEDGCRSFALKTCMLFNAFYTLYSILYSIL